MILTLKKNFASSILQHSKRIHNYYFYNNHAKLYFEYVEDIDMNFFKENLDVEYHYKGENSPVNLIDFIEINL